MREDDLEFKASRWAGLLTRVQVQGLPVQISRALVQNFRDQFQIRNSRKSRSFSSLSSIARLGKKKRKEKRQEHDMMLIIALKWT
jgi:hypothetical protein